MLPSHADQTRPASPGRVGIKQALPASDPLLDPAFSPRPNSDEILSVVPSTTSPEPHRYQLLEEVARGGMGIVYRAADPEMKRCLAIKVLREEHARDPGMQHRFLEEARIAGRLQHPGIVPIHDIGRFADGRPWFSMKLIEGRTLSALLAARSAPSSDLPRFLAIYEQVCQTIAYAHSRNILHRDLKPANIMVGAFGEVQVMDWGLAKELRIGAVEPVGGEPASAELPTQGAYSFTDLTERFAGTAIGQVAGTPAYMAPEQAHGVATDKRVDVFGLGGILCEILTGMPPYILANHPELWILQRQRNHAELLERLDRCGAEPALIALARRALAVNPEDRYADAGELAAEITAYRSGVEERLRQLELDRVAARAGLRANQRSRRLVGVLAVVTVLFIALGAGVAWWSHLRYETTAQRITLALEEVDRLTKEANEGRESLSWNLDRAVALWRQARVALDQATEAVELGVTSDALRQRVARARQNIDAEWQQLSRETELMERLARTRQARDDDYGKSDLRDLYREVFKRSGVDLSASPDEVRETIRSRPLVVIAEIVAALDDWCNEHRRYGSPDTEWHALVRLAMSVDDDAWRNELRSKLLQPIPSLPGERIGHSLLVDFAAHGLPGMPSFVLIQAGIEFARYRSELIRLADRPETDRQPAASLLLLASMLRQASASSEALQLLRGAQRRLPGNPWIHHELALTLTDLSPRFLPEALRAHTAARALRPEVGHAMAHALEANKQPEEAELLLRELIRLRPRNADHYACLGLNLAKRQQFIEAIALLEKAIQLAPRDASNYAALGGVLWNRRNLPDAEKNYRKAVTLNPGDASFWINYARVLEENKRFPEAETATRRATALAPENTGFLFYQGLLFDRQGKRAEAVQAWTRLVGIDPKHPEGHANLGITLLQVGRFDEAEKHLRLALQWNPELGPPNHYLGLLLSERHQQEASLPYLREAVRLLPGHSPSIDALQMALLRTNRLQEARQVYDVAVRRFPDSHLLRYHRALYLGQGRDVQDEVIRLYREAVALGPDHPESHCNLGLALCRVGRPKEGLPFLRRGDLLGKRDRKWVYPSADWVRFAERMAKAEEVLPEVVAGRWESATFGELFDVAVLCRLRDRNVTSHRILLEVLRREPDLIDVPNRFPIEDAILSALRAGAGLGSDAAPLTPAQRFALRKQALTWLETRTNKKAGFEIHWFEEKGFRFVREPGELKKLAPEEAEAWQRFWRKVQAGSPNEQS